MSFRSVLVTRSYEQVIEQIHDGIRSGALTPGQRLPTERELGETFGVSRGVIREALKVLASMGLVESRQGSGNYVAANPVPSISRALILSATTQEESLLALFEVREPLETFAVRLAAERRTDEQLARIAAAAAASATAAAANNLTQFGDADDLLHRGISDAAGNPYLATFVAAIRELLSQGLRLAVGIAGAMTTAAEHHVAIADAIARRDAEAATTYMRDHIHYSANALRSLVASGHRIDVGPLLDRR